MLQYLWVIGSRGGECVERTIRGRKAMANVSGEEKVNVDTREQQRQIEAEKRIAIMKNGKEFLCIRLGYSISLS